MDLPYQIPSKKPHSSHVDDSIEDSPSDNLTSKDSSSPVEKVPFGEKQMGRHEGKRKRSNQKEKQQKKTDISLGDLLGVKEYSFELQSPLSSNPNREQNISNHPLNDVEEEDILKADSLPITMKSIKDLKIINEQDSITESEPIESPLISNRADVDKLFAKKGKVEQVLQEKSFNIKTNRENPQVIYKDHKEKEILPRKSDINLSNKRNSKYTNENQFEETGSGVPKEKEHPVIPLLPIVEKLDSHASYRRKHVAVSHANATSKSSSETGPQTTNLKQANQTQASESRLSPSRTTLESYKKAKLASYTAKNRTKITTFGKSNNIVTNNFTLEDRKLSVPVAFYSSFARSEPYFLPIEYQYGFSKLVETEESPFVALNNTFPRYTKSTDHKKEVIINAPKKPGHFLSIKTVGTQDTGLGFKNLNSNMNTHANPNINTKEGKFLTSQTKSANHFYVKLKGLQEEQPHSPLVLK